MTIRKNDELGGHDIICDQCNSMFSSEEGETPGQIEHDMVRYNNWKIVDGKHICFRCAQENAA